MSFALIWPLEIMGISLKLRILGRNNFKYKKKNVMKDMGGMIQFDSFAIVVS